MDNEKKDVRAELESIARAEIKSRHINTAKLIQKKALDALAEMQPADLKPGELRQLLKTAQETERALAPLATDQQEQTERVGKLFRQVWESVE